MFNTIAEGIERYKTELREYVAWTSGRKIAYGCGASALHWGAQDYERITSLSDKLKGMEEALGLTRPEIDRIGGECGVERAVAKAG
jgi:hypothetical protein